MRSREGSFCSHLALAALTDSPYGEDILDSSDDFVAIPFPGSKWARRCDLHREAGESLFRPTLVGFWT
jgi:hypothetical protein